MTQVEDMFWKGQEPVTPNLDRRGNPSLDSEPSDESDGETDTKYTNEEVRRKGNGHSNIRNIVRTH